MHATVDMSERALRLSGRSAMQYPFWASIDTHQADWRTCCSTNRGSCLLGLLSGAIAWTSGLGRSPTRRWWAAAWLAAILALTVAGLASATGVIGKFIVG
jgi:hypothetical protein